MGGANPQGGGTNLFHFTKFCLEKCMKTKEFGPGGGDAPLDPPMVNLVYLISTNLPEVLLDQSEALLHL